MLEMDGYVVLKVLCEILYMVWILFIFLMVCGEYGDVCSGMMFGVDDYLIKLVGVLDLLVVIMVWLSWIVDYNGSGVVKVELKLEML